MEVPRDLNPQAPPFKPTSSITSTLFQHLMQTPPVSLPCTVPPLATIPQPQTIYSPYHTYCNQPQPTAVVPPPPPLTHLHPRPPPYTQYYVVQPSPYASSTNLLPISSPQPGLPTSLLVYNIFNQHHALMHNWRPQRPVPLEVNEQFVTPPGLTNTTQHNNEARAKTHTKVRPRGGSRAAKGGQTTTNGLGRGVSSSRMTNANRQGFGGKERGQRYGKFGSWKVTNKEEKHQVIPVRPDEANTTVMIKNIPYAYNREKLIKFLDDYCLLENERSKSDDKHFVSAYDFVYLPIDFRTKKSRGFAFVNFTDPRAVWRFLQAFHNKLWFFDRTPKIIEIVSAKIQGKEALVTHFQSSMFECDTDMFLPLSFIPARDGSSEPVEQVTVGKRLARNGKYEASSPSQGSYNQQT